MSLRLRAPRLRADRLLVDRGLFESRTRAQAAIAAGLVSADGARVAKPSDMLRPDAVIEAAPAHPFVSRGALKLAAGLDAVKGDVSRKADMIKAMENAKIDSPRGPWTLSKAHNPVQDIYLRKVEGKQNKVAGVAVKALADPARGCKA